MLPSFYSIKPPQVVPISLFVGGARERQPVNKAPTVEGLAAALTRFKVRQDISAKAQAELTALDAWISRLVMSGGKPPNDLSRGASTWARIWRDSALIGTLDARVDRFRAQQAKRIWSRHKTAIPAWSPTIYAPRATRSAAAVKAVTALVLDIDDGATLEDILEVWGKFFFVAHTSWSHKEDAPKIRVVIFLAEPVKSKDWPKAWEWAKNQFPSMDEACSDASRIYFIPAIKGPNSPHWFHVNEGQGFLQLVGDHVPHAPRPRPLPKVKPRPPITVPGNEAERVMRFRMDRDPATRRRVALDVSAKIRGAGDRERATRAPCPSSGRASDWWYIHPSQKATASCDHNDSCGWFGRLWEVK